MMTHVHKDDVYLELLGLREELDKRVNKQGRKNTLRGLKAKPLGDSWAAFEELEKAPRAIT